tara:strand:- start:463 stop:1506 length:1044 start_codon:yes stop_codon:yes gene_type:complete
MKNLIFIFYILIILTKTGNVLSNNAIFNVNNIEINKAFSKNREELIKEAFRKSFDQLINRLLLKEDYEKISRTDLKTITSLISYYQISSPEEIENRKENVEVNISYDKDKLHDFFYSRNILYADIINSEIIIFPLLKIKNQNYIYNNNYFYENWNKNLVDDYLQFSLLGESIENIQKINVSKENIYKIDLNNFFKEFEFTNVAFITINLKKNSAEIFLNSRIEGKNIKKNFNVKKDKDKDDDFNNQIILEISNIIKDLVKKENLIDVKTPSFINVELKMKKNDNLIIFNDKLKRIDLVDSFFVQQFNKDYVLIKIKYLGKIDKIIKKLKEQNIELKMISGEWQLRII